MELFDQDAPEESKRDIQTPEMRCMALEEKMHELEAKVELLGRFAEKSIGKMAENQELTGLLTMGLGEMANVLGNHSKEIFKLKGEDDKAAEVEMRLGDFRANMQEHGFGPATSGPLIISEDEPKNEDA